MGGPGDDTYVIAKTDNGSDVIVDSGGVDTVRSYAATFTLPSFIENLTVVGAMLSVPGPVAESTVVKFSPQLGWRDVDAGLLLRNSLENLPIAVDNEARDPYAG